nr:MAG TPA: Methuselah N-terminus [Caudoviricetes sp.]DAI22544.1 MAG TPA: Methuselah N-terminus [Caudoviricetes sp.]
MKSKLGQTAYTFPVHYKYNDRGFLLQADLEFARKKSCLRRCCAYE